MLQYSDYEVFIFDCDGVILDSNELKIEAMKVALQQFINDENKIADCIDYFKNNFGTSRFNHIKHFVDVIFNLPDAEKKCAYDDILENYAEQCKALYLDAQLTPGIIDFIKNLNGPIYIASGSEQGELREVFKRRNLDIYFTGIYGSPTPKVDLVSNIIKRNKVSKAVMFGDALSDMKSAVNNTIDFVAYLPYSNVKEELQRESVLRGFPIINSWEDLIC